MFIRKTPNPFARDAALCNLMSGHGVTLAVVGDTCPKTDGKVIWIPPTPIGADETDREIHDHSVAHEPAHITEGSFDVDAKTGQFLHDIWNFVEDARVEWSQEKTKYPGLKVFRAEFLTNFSKYEYRMGTNKMLCAKFGEGVIRGGLCMLLLESRGAQLGVKPGYKASPEVQRFYAKNLKKYLPAVLSLKDCAGSYELAKKIHALLTEGLINGTVKPVDDFDNTGGFGAGDKYEDGDNIVAALNEATPSLSDQAKYVSAQGLGIFKPTALKDKKTVSTTRNEAFKLTTRGRTILGPHGARMTHMFVTNSRPRTVHGKLDGRLDPRAVANDHWDVRRDLYKVRVRGATDRAAVSFLLDFSASMDSSIGTLASVVMGLGYYLDRARVPFSIHGFGTYFHTVKEFEEPWRGEAPRRMVISSLDGSTHTAWAMEHVARKLMARTEGKKVLIVLTDGSPADSGREIPYCLRMSRVLRSHGAVVVGIGLGIDLSKMFGEDFINLPVDDSLGRYLVDRLGGILGRKTRVQ